MSLRERKEVQEMPRRGSLIHASRRGFTVSRSCTNSYQGRDLHKAAHSLSPNFELQPPAFVID